MDDQGWNRVDEWAGIELAFCPGEGPADNSCSSSGGAGGSDVDRFKEKIAPYADKAKDAWAYNENTGGLSMNFKTKSGRQFFIHASKNHEITFNDDAASTANTGKGGAHEVFANVLGGISHYVNSEHPDKLAFSASSSSRIKLYDRLAKSFKALHPEYTVKYQDARDEYNQPSRIYHAWNAAKHTPGFGARNGKELSLAFEPGDEWAGFEFGLEPSDDTLELQLAFCPNGAGGGVDDSCSPGGSGGGRDIAAIRADIFKARHTLNNTHGFEAQNKARGKLQALNAELKASRPAGADPHYARFKNAIDDETPAAYKDTKDGQASADFHNSQFKDWAKSLDAKSKDAITVYSGGAFSTINDGLRGVEKLDSDSKSTIKALDSAFKFAPALTEGVTVYRGGGLHALGKDPEKMVGKTITDKGFVSTTTALGVANGFAGEGGDSGKVVRYDIEVPKGTKALSPDAALGADSLGQHELILPRGSTFKITKVEKRTLKSGVVFYNVKATLSK